MNSIIDKLRTQSEFENTQDSLDKLKDGFVVSEDKQDNEGEISDTQVESDTQNIDDLYVSVLDSLKQTPATEEYVDSEEKKWLLAKFKWRIWDTWENFKKKDKKEKTRAWIIAAWVWIFTLWYFSKKSRAERKQKRKERREARKQDRKENQKDFWDKPIGKVLKWIGIWTSIYYIWRWLSSWDWSTLWWKGFSKEKKDWKWTTPWSSVESSEKSYDKLPEVDKKVYEDSAIAVNEYQQNIMWDENWSQEVEDLMWDSDFDNDKAGLIPFMLSNRYANLDKMLSETSFYYEIIWTEWHIAWNKIKDWGLDWLKMVLRPLVWVVNWLTFDLLNLDEWWDKLIEKLKSIDGLEEKLRTIFRKSITVMSYYQSRKWALESQIAENLLTEQDSKFSKLSEEKKAEEISDHLQDEERYKQPLEPEFSNFMQLNLKDATTYLQSKNLLNWDLDIQMKYEINKVEKSRKRLLNIEDDDDTSILEDMKNEFHDWRLSEKYQEKLKDFCEEFKEEMFISGRQTWYAKYLPMFNILWADSDFLKNIQSTGDYDNIANIYMSQVDLILQKSEDWSLEESDLDLLEETVNDYYKFKKSLISSEINIWKMVDENWNIVIRRMRSIVIWWSNIMSWIQICTWAKEWKIGEWLWLIWWWFVSVDALTFWCFGRHFGLPIFDTLNKKVIFPVAKGWLRLTGRWIERLTWNVARANFWGILPARFFTENTLRISLARWEVSLDRAIKIANYNWFKVSNVPNAPVINNKIDLIKRMFYVSDEAEAGRLANVLERFWDNPNIYKNIMRYKYDMTRSSRKRPEDWLKLNRDKQLYKLDSAAVIKLDEIGKRIDNMTVWTQKKVMQSMMSYVKNIDQAEELSKIWLWDDMAKLLESWQFIKAEEYWKYLAKYASKIDAKDMRAFEKFIIEAKNAWKVWENWWLFVRNALKNFAKIKERWFIIDKIDDLGLNVSRRSKLAEWTKARLTQMSSQLREMSKNPRFKPFSKNIARRADAVSELWKTVTPEWMKAMKSYKLFWTETAFTKLSTEWMHQLSRLSYMLHDVDIAKNLTKALKWAKTLDEVKDILSQQWIAVKHIDDTVLLKIAKSGNARTICDVVDYGAWFNTIKWLQKFLKNPVVKQTWRVIGRGLVVLDMGLVWYNFYSEYSEAQIVKQFNLERWEWKEWQAYFELAAWWIGAMSGAAMLIPWLMVIPWVWWILWWVLATSIWIMEVWNKYYKDIEKFKQNQADFLSKWIAAAKQELTSIDSRDQWLSRTFIDNLSVYKNLPYSSAGAHLLWLLWSSSVEKKEASLPKTKADALEALIRMEEIQKNPLAWADLNNPENIEKPDLVEAIRLSKQQLEDTVQKRMQYFKNKYLNENKPIVDGSQYLSNQPLSALEYELQLSSISAQMDNDVSYEWEMDPEKYLEAKFNKLKQLNKHNFEKLEKIFSENPHSLFLMYAELPYYKSKVSEYSDANLEKIIESCDFFEEYMSYKMLWKSISSYPDIDINLENIDYNQIDTFLSNFDIIPTQYTEKELKYYEKISDEEILERFWVSGILWQDILYECAKILDYNWNNSLDNLKMFFQESKKEVHWIYYDEKKAKRSINKKTRGDDTFAADSELNSLDKIKDMRDYVDSHANSWRKWKMFNENSYINVEIWNKILKIINEYISLREWAFDKLIESYVKEHWSNGNYISLSEDLIIKWRKMWLEWVWEYLYRFENWKITKN